MKKLAAAALAFLLLFAGCGAKEEAPIQVDFETGTFLITPQDFIDRWNDSLETYKEKSKDEKDQYLISIPDFEESGEAIELCNGLYITFDTHEKTQNIQELTIFWNSRSISEEGNLTLGVMLVGIPYLLDSKEDFDPVEKFDMKMTNDGINQTISAGNCRYWLRGENTSSFFTISALELHK